MSQKFPGGFITKSPVAPTTTAASGIWTLDQQEQYQQAGTWPSPPPPPYIEDVFSTYLYTGNGGNQTITNGIDLATKGGLVWMKCRSTGTTDNTVYDTARGVNYPLFTNTTAASSSDIGTFAAFNTTGFRLNNAYTALNETGQTYASWTFRKQPKFFDVVTYTGNGGSSQAISHALGSTPGCVIVKRTDSTSFWLVWHRGFSSPDVSYGYLNSTDPFSPDSPNNNWAAAPTGTTFTPAGNYNVNGATYVAYLFAHDAGGFGATETENVISCGSFTTDGSGNGSVTLGYEPQWVLIKRTDDLSQWYLADNMRGMPVSGSGARLFPNLTNAESTSTSWVRPNATGFTLDPGMFATAVNLIYIAIRRGPMKVPTDGTKVFSPNVYNTAPSSPLTVTTNFPVDLSISTDIQGGQGQVAMDRLRSAEASSLKFLQPNTTGVESSSSGIGIQSNTALIDSGFWAGYSYKPVYWNFRRAPSFFDEVCYTGTGTAGQTYTHNLGVAPELMIVKNRSVAGDNWEVLCAFGTVQRLRLNLTTAGNTSVEALFGDGSSYIAPTSTTFTVANLSSVNGSGNNLVAYLFATCAGVSKVGSYTGTGALQTINCGFTSGARFILIKRTDSTGDWYTYDSARGISSSSDPYILMNRDLAQVTGTNYVDTDSTGFQVTAAAPAALNASGGTYIYLAIA